jgi:hypothetical protein
LRDIADSPEQVEYDMRIRNVNVRDAAYETDLIDSMAKEAAKKMNPVRYVQEWRSVIGRLWSGENIAMDRPNISVYWGSFFRLYESWQRFSHMRHDISIIRADCGELRNVMKEFYG